MTLWFTSDTHLFHTKILEYEPERGKKWSSVEDMNEGIIESHNKLVKDKDTVWFLGDCGFASEIKIVEAFRRFKGDKHLIRGNHDYIKDFDLWKTAFKTIDSYKELSFDKQKIVLLHFGMRVWNKSHHGSIHLHGHSHGSLPPFGKSVDVGLDAPWITGIREHRPFSFDEIKEYMSKREMQFPDKHSEKTND